MPQWRLFAQDGEGWLDLHEIVEGDRLDAEAACARAEAVRPGCTVNAEPITDPAEPGINPQDHP
jgi:hypothetical protein